MYHRDESGLQSRYFGDGKAIQAPPKNSRAHNVYMHQRTRIAEKPHRHQFDIPYVATPS